MSRTADKAFASFKDNFVPSTGGGANSSLTVLDVSATVIKLAFQLSGLIFFILMVYAGFTWILSRGEEDKATKAKTILKAATIGFIITVSAYQLVAFLAGRILEN